MQLRDHRGKLNHRDECYGRLPRYAISLILEIMAMKEEKPHVRCVSRRPTMIAIALGKNEILRENPLSSAEIEKLIDRAFEIYNRYSSLFRASTFARNISGHDDYLVLLKFLRIGIKHSD